MFTLAGSTAVFGIVQADVPLLDRAFQSTRVFSGKSIKLGTAAGIAVTGSLASYEIFQASQTSDPSARLSHFEGASATVVDGLFAMLPLYVEAAILAWQMGLVGSV